MYECILCPFSLSLAALISRLAGHRGSTGSKTHSLAGINWIGMKPFARQSYRIKQCVQPLVNLRFGSIKSDASHPAGEYCWLLVADKSTTYKTHTADEDGTSRCALSNISRSPVRLWYSITAFQPRGWKTREWGRTAAQWRRSGQRPRRVAWVNAYCR